MAASGCRRERELQVWSQRFCLSRPDGVTDILQLHPTWRPRGDLLRCRGWRRPRLYALGAGSCSGLGFGRYRPPGSPLAPLPPSASDGLIYPSPPLLFPLNAPLKTSLSNAPSPQQPPSLLLSLRCQTATPDSPFGWA